MENQFDTLAGIIKSRRSIKPAQMNGRIIPDTQIQELLALADWAPTHGNTEPWRFFVYSGDAVKQFCSEHADLYKENTSAEKYLKANYDKLVHNGDLVSHIIVVAMQRGRNPKITVTEEVASVSSAVQNILLGATSFGIASMWSTSGMAHHPAMKKYFHLREEDMVMGIIYLGYTDILASGKRIVPLIEKIKWNSFNNNSVK